MGAVRETRLDPQFSTLYPMIPSGVWLPASDVGARMLEWALLQSEAPAFANRLLNDEHFQFRGGAPREPVPAGGVRHTRREDAERTATA
jgi:hypothetical protein